MTNPNPDTDFIPLGEGPLQQIEDMVLTHRDAAESLALEAKSELDLTKAAGRAKVAKFILGAANRQPRTARTHFKGYAVMVIGVDKGSVNGITRAPEQHQLADALAKYLGPDGPTWNIARRRIDDTHDIVFILVDPPEDGDPVYICRGTYDGDDRRDQLRDGAIYVRDSTQTREAKSSELTALFTRQGAGPAPTVDLQITGSILHLTNTTETLDSLIKSDAKQIRSQATAPRQHTPAFPAHLPPTLVGNTLPPLPAADDDDSLAARAATLSDRWPGCVQTLAAVAGPRIRITVTNTSDRYLNDPELNLTIPNAHCQRALQPSLVDRHELLPTLPRSQGFTMPKAHVRYLRQPVGDCPTTWRNDEHSHTCCITLTPRGLPPHTARIADLELVLTLDETVAQPLQAAPANLQSTWALVSPDITGQLTGTLTIPVFTAPTNELFATTLKSWNEA